MNGASGPLKNDSLTSSRICTRLSQARSIVSTQSQFEVCGAPTRMPRLGTVADRLPADRPQRHAGDGVAEEERSTHVVNLAGDP